MKVFKTLDFFVQVILVLLIIAGFIIQDYEILNPGVFILVLAGWQILSLLSNAVAGPKPWKMKKLRKYHLLGIALVILLLIVAGMQGEAAKTGDKDDKYSMAGLGTAAFALIPAVLLAAFYVWISYAEWKKIKQEA